MSMLEPANPTQIAQQVRERLETMLDASGLELGDALTFARAVELSRLFSSVQVLGDLIGSVHLARVAGAAATLIATTEIEHPVPLQTRVAIDRGTQELRRAVATLAEGGDIGSHEPGLRVAAAMLLETQVTNEEAAGEPLVMSSTEAKVESACEDSLSDLDLFVGSVVKQLEVARHAIDALSSDPTDRGAVAAAFRAIHTARGDAGVMSAASLEAACLRLEMVLEALRSGEAIATSRVVESCYSLVDFAMKAVTEPATPVDDAALDRLVGSLDEGRSLARATRLGELLVDQQMVDEHDVELALAIKSGPVGRTLVNLRVIGDDDLDQVLELQKTLRREGAVRDRQEGPSVKRVSVSEDTLVELTKAVRELQTRVVDLPTIPLMQNVMKLTNQLQQQTMGALFRKLARAARALADELGKEVWVSVTGSGVEVHREIVHDLDAPMLQLVRNALDHGIERPPLRRVGGKPTRATLSLVAELEGPNLVVEVADDGAGIDIQRVLQQGIDMGLVSPADAAKLRDEEAQRLIFAPGLSGTSRVGRISGRGVGMDVVEHAVSRLGGAIEVQSQRGLGTRFRLTIPHRR